MDYQSIEEKYISDFHGMEKLPIAESNRRHNENGVVLLSAYMFMKNDLRDFNEEDKIIYNTIIRNLRTFRNDGTRILGLFDRGMEESKNPPTTDISHDNISSIAAFSHLNDLPYHLYIYQHGVENKWRFDNAQPDKPRWSRLMHPRDIIYWSRLGGGKIGKSIAWCFMWMFYLSQIHSCWKKWKVRPSLWHKLRMKFTSYEYQGNTSKGYSSSGKQMAFIRMYPLRKTSFVARLVWKLCVKLVDGHGRGGFSYVFDHYYDNEHFSDHNPNHPLIGMAKRVF